MSNLIPAAVLLFDPPAARDPGCLAPSLALGVLAPPVSVATVHLDLARTPWQPLSS